MSRKDPYAEFQGPATDPYAEFSKPAAEPSWFNHLVNEIVDFGKEFNSGANPASAASKQGQAAIVYHPLDTAKAMVNAQGKLGQDAKQSFQQGNYLDGIRHTIAYLLPVIGPAIDEAGNKAGAGKIGAGLGQAAGLAVPLALGMRESAPPTPNPKASGLANNLYREALGVKSDTPIADARAMAGTGLGNNIPVTEAGSTKLSGLIHDLNNAIDAQVAKTPGSVDKYKVASRLNDTAAKFGNQVTPEADLQAITDSGNEFLRNQPADISNLDAQNLKKGTYEQLGKKSFGELKTAQIEAQKTLARGLKEELAVHIPELTDLNAQEGKLLDLQPVLERAVNRAANAKGSWLRDLATTGVVKTVTGNSSLAVASGVLRNVLADPGVRSQLAIAINKAQQRFPMKYGKPSMAAAFARVDSLANISSQATSPSASSPESN